MRRLRLLSLYPTFWPRQGGGQMVLAAIAEGLSSRLTNQVLTRRFANTGVRKDYEFLTVHYFWNPAPEVWKDYAMGIRQVSFAKLTGGRSQVTASVATSSGPASGPAGMGSVPVTMGRSGEDASSRGRRKSSSM